ncbi:MAG: hypothetical protein IKU25_04950 [Clostridia bacterium]|nr:hypothetical protein [Clostridia bacterium]
MKKRLLAIVLCFIMLFCTIPFSASADETNVIADENLLAALIEQGYDANLDGNISASEMEEVFFLEISGLGITSLEGLQYALNLMVLDASKNNISDVSVLVDLSIVILDLSFNNLSGALSNAITDMALLTNLTLSHNELTSVAGITNLTELTFLDLSFNKLDNAEELIGFHNIDTLYVNNNLFSLRPVEGDLGHFYEIMSNLPDAYKFIYAPQLVGGITEDFVIESIDENLLTALIDNGVDVNNDGLITACELGTVYNVLDLGGYGISDISALSFAINTPAIILRENNVSSVAALGGLTELIELDISFNNITDLSPLCALTKMTALDASNNEIESADGLDGVSSLFYLNLSNNNLTDVSALKPLMSLNIVNLSDNFISSIEMDGVIGEIDLSYNLFTSTEDLVKLNTFQLDITYNNLNPFDISKEDFPYVTNLYYSEQMEYEGSYRDEVTIPDPVLLSILLQQPGINANGDNVITKGELAGYKNALNLTGTAVKDLTGLRYMKRLSVLRIDDTEISDISEVAGMIRLAYFTAGNSEISDISPLAQLTELQTITAINTNITNIDALKSNRLYSLTSINLSGNGITDASALGYIPTLKIIKLNSNSISDIGFMSSITAPEIVYLNDNEIVSIESLDNISTLVELDISKNRIKLADDFEATMFAKNVNLSVLLYDEQNVSVKVDVTINVTGENFFELTINGVDHDIQPSYSDVLDVGAVFTVVAVEDAGEFLYWKNSKTHKIVSYEKEYTFVAVSSTNLTAVYNRNYSNRGYVSFFTAFDQELSRSLYSVNDEAQDIEIPEPAPYQGRVFVGWSIDGVNPIASDLLADEIILALQNGNVNLYPIYAMNDTYYTVTVENGTGSGSFVASSVVAITANTAPSGQKFAYWVDGNGQIISYKETYYFIIMNDCYFTAVFVDEDEVVDQFALISISEVYSTPADRTVSFVALRDIPTEYTVVQNGIILTNDATIGTDESAFILDAAGTLKGVSSSNDNKGTSIAVKSNVSPGDTWYARAFVVYLDTNGELVYIYSTIESITA